MLNIFAGSAFLTTFSFILVFVSEDLCPQFSMKLENIKTSIAASVKQSQTMFSKAKPIFKKQTKFSKVKQSLKKSNKV